MDAWRMIDKSSYYRWTKYFHRENSKFKTSFMHTSQSRHVFITNTYRTEQYHRNQNPFQTIMPQDTNFRVRWLSRNKSKITHNTEKLFPFPLMQQKVSQNPVSALQEICVKKGWHLPYYRTEEVSMPQGLFYLTICEVQNVNSSGRDKIKRISKRKAALEMLNFLKESGKLIKLGEKQLFENASLSFINMETTDKANNLLKISEIDENVEDRNERQTSPEKNLSHSNEKSEFYCGSISGAVTQKMNEQNTHCYNGNFRQDLNVLKKDEAIINNLIEMKENRQIYLPIHNELEEMSDEETYINMTHSKKRVSIKHAKGAAPKRLKFTPEEQETLLKLNNLKIFECIATRENSEQNCHETNTIIQRTISI